MIHDNNKLFLFNFAFEYGYVKNPGKPFRSFHYLKNIRKESGKIRGKFTNVDFIGWVGNQISA